jgi:uroporphyrinogen decarboxylase
MEMTSHERIMATIARQPTDCRPVDLWCTPEVLDSLRLHTGIDDEFEIYRSLGVDKIVWIFPGYNGRYFDPNDSGEITMWGVPTRMMKAGLATYQEYINPPLAGMEDPAALADYPSWPSPDNFDYEGSLALARRARRFGFATNGPWISHFEIYCQMRGIENALLDTLAFPDLLDAALDRIDAIQTTMLHRFLKTLGDNIDMIFISDDMGMQHNMLLSVDAWNTFFRSRLKNWCNLIHSYGKKVFYHTDGAVLPLIPHLIDCGIDILNPIQHLCPGMDMANMKREFGDRIIFHGGIDNQHALPHGSADDVRRETLDCISTLGRNGGYICCTCHNAQAGTPVENLLTMIETVKNYQ